MSEVAYQHPRVVAGLPVYNGQDYLVEALDSLLAQDYPNLEILISDNASTDDTARIACQYAAAHPSITYVRQPVNLGASGNFDYLRRAVDSDFFFWAGAHDRWEPRFVSELVDVLVRQPDLIASYSAGCFLEADGTRRERMGFPYSFTSRSAALRYLQMVLYRQLYIVYGVFRLGPLQDMPFWQRCMGPDIMQVNHLVLKGRIAGVDKELFYMRRAGEYGSAVRYFANLQMPFSRRNVWRYIVAYQCNHIRVAFMELPPLSALGVSLVVTPLLFVKSWRLYAGLIVEAFAPRLMKRIRDRIRVR